MTRAAALFAVLSSLVVVTGCPAAASTAATETLVLRAYDVPAEHAAELQGILSSLLYTGKDQPRKGSAALAPSGQLLVSAPAEFQPGIAEVVSKLKSAPSVRAPTVKIDYWIVAGTTSSSPTSGATIAPEIGDVVDALQKSQGPMKLALLERLGVASQSGSEGAVQGATTFANQTASLHGDKIVLQIDLRGENYRGNLRSRVEIPLGQTAVLGQGGVELKDDRIFAGDDALAAASKSGKLTAFYILRATVDGK